MSSIDNELIQILKMKYAELEQENLKLKIEKEELFKQICETNYYLDAVGFPTVKKLATSYIDSVGGMEVYYNGDMNLANKLFGDGE